MVSKFMTVFALIGVASAGLLPAPQVYHAAPQTIAVAQPLYTKAVESYDPHPKYQFAYAVNDEHTGDVKNQIESRDGDLVQGEYSLIDSDGYKRTVQYSADHEHGFNAVVHREPLGYAVKAAPVIKAAPVAYAAPALIKSAPVAYAAAPAAQLAYAAAPAAYASQAIVKSAPAYGSAPAYSYGH